MSQSKSRVWIAGAILGSTLALSAPALAGNPKAPNLEQQFMSLAGAPGSSQPFAFKFGSHPDRGDLAPLECIFESLASDIAAVVDPFDLGYADAVSSEILDAIGTDPCVWKASHYQGMVRGNRADGTPLFVLSRNGSGKKLSYGGDKSVDLLDVCKDVVPDVDMCIPLSPIGECCETTCTARESCIYFPWPPYKECWCDPLNLLVGDCCASDCVARTANPQALCDELGDALGFPPEIGYCDLFDLADLSFRCIHDTPGDLLVVEMLSRPKDGGSIGDYFSNVIDQSTGLQQLDTAEIQYTHPGGGQLIAFQVEGGGPARQVAFFGTNGWCNKDQHGRCRKLPGHPDSGIVVLALDPTAWGLARSELRAMTHYDSGDGTYGPIPSLQNMALMQHEGSGKLLFADLYGREISFYSLGAEQLESLIENNQAARPAWLGAYPFDDFPNKPQTVSFVQDRSGVIHLITTHNSPRGASPPRDDDNYEAYNQRVDTVVRLFKVVTTWPDEASASFSFEYVGEVLADLGPFDIGGEDYMGDVLAGATAYVSPSGRLFIYSSEHTPMGPSVLDGCTDPDCYWVRMGELSSTSPVLFGPAAFVAREGTLETVALGEFSIGGDPGGRSWTARVELGDGLVVTMAHPSPGSPLSVRHSYVEGPNEFTASIRVQETGAYYGKRTVAVTVENVAPTVTAADPQVVDEGAVLALEVAGFSDPGTLDTHTATIDWGDGSAIEAGLVTESPFGPPGLPPAYGTVAGSHVYADDGSYTVTVTVTDDDGGVGAASFVVRVDNVVPSTDAGRPQVIYEGDVLELEPATFNDPGTLDTHTAQIEWGDGSPTEAGEVVETPFGPPGDTAGLDGEVHGNHQYLVPPGHYTAIVTVEDDDGATGSSELDIAVAHGFLRFCAFADDKLEIEKEAVVECGLVPGGAPDETRMGGTASRGQIKVKKATTMTGELMSTEDKVEVEKETLFEGGIRALGEVKLKQDIQIVGNVISASDIELEKRVTVVGDVTASGEVKMGSGCSVSGAVSQHADVPPIPAITGVTPELVAGGPDVKVDKDDFRTLGPGSYGKLKVDERAVLVLEAGVYHFEKFEVKKQATVSFDLGVGVVVVDVVDKLSLEEDVEMTIVSTESDAEDILFRVGGKVDLDKQGSYLGTYLAPYGELKLGEGARLEGALYGHKVKLEKETHIIGRPALEVFMALFVTP